MGLYFRKMKETDMEKVMGWRTSRDVSKYMFTDFVPGLESQRAWCRLVSADSTKRYWIITVNGEDVGVANIVNIDNLNHRGEGAYYLISPHLHNEEISVSVELSLQRYAFENLEVHKLCCDEFLTSAVLIRIHEKCGAAIESTRREHIFKGGQFHDIIEMAVFGDNRPDNRKDKVEYIRGEFE